MMDQYQQQQQQLALAFAEKALTKFRAQGTAAGNEYARRVAVVRRYIQSGDFLRALLWIELCDVRP
jgi:hypothetical protein